MDSIKISDGTKAIIIIVAAFLLFMMLESCTKEPRVNIDIVSVSQESYFVTGYYDNNNVFVPVSSMIDSTHQVYATTYTDSLGIVHSLDSYPRYGEVGPKLIIELTIIVMEP